MCTKLFGEQVVGKLPGLFKSVVSLLGNLKVYPVIVDVGMQVVLTNRFNWEDVGELNPNILMVIKWCAMVEVFDVTCKFSQWLRCDTVEKKLDNFEQTNFCDVVAWVAVSIAPNVTDYFASWRRLAEIS